MKPKIALLFLKELCSMKKKSVPQNKKKAEISMMFSDLLFLLGVDKRELLTPPLLPLALALPSLPNPLPLPLPLPLPVGVAQPDTGRDIVNDIRRLPERRSE